MIKVISKYTFLLRSGEKRQTVYRGQAVEVSEDELKKFQNKFILYSDAINNKKPAEKIVSK